MRHSVQQEHSLSLSLSPDRRKRRSAKYASAPLELQGSHRGGQVPVTTHMEPVGTEVRALKTVKRMTTTSLQLGTWLERLTADQQVPGSNPGVPSFAHTPLHLRTWKTEIEPVRQRKMSTRAVPICCAKARACFRRTLTRCIVLLTERTCSSVPSWPNNQKIAGASPAGTVRNRLDSCCSQNHGRRNGGSPQAVRGGANTIAKSKVKASPPTSLHARVRTSLA